MCEVVCERNGERQTERRFLAAASSPTFPFPFFSSPLALSLGHQSILITVQAMGSIQNELSQKAHVHTPVCGFTLTLGIDLKANSVNWNVCGCFIDRGGLNFEHIHWKGEKLEAACLPHNKKKLLEVQCLCVQLDKVGLQIKMTPGYLISFRQVFEINWEF